MGKKSLATINAIMLAVLKWFNSLDLLRSLLLISSITILFILFTILYNYWCNNNVTVYYKYKYKHDGFYSIPGFIQHWPKLLNNNNNWNNDDCDGLDNYNIYKSNSSYCNCPIDRKSTYKSLRSGLILRSYNVFHMHRNGNGIKYNRYNPLCIIIFNHDIGSYNNHNMLLAYNLSRLGYSYHAIDYQGFGESEGDRGHINNYNDILNDILDFTLYIKKLYSISPHNNIPIFIGGIGFGSNLSMLLAQQHNHLYSGLILLSPVIRLLSINKYNQYIIRTIYRLFPRVKYCKLYELGSMSRNMNIIQHYKSDKLFYNNYKYNLHTLNQLLLIIQATNHILPKLHTPFIVCHGVKDLIYCPSSSRDLFIYTNSIGNNLKRFVVNAKSWHDLLHENEYYLFIDNITDWIQQTLLHIKLRTQLD